MQELEGKKILVVDDEPNMLAALRRQLGRLFCVDTESDAVVALSRLHETEYSVIVSDMRMPGMSGTDFLQKATEIRPDAVRIMLTGNADQMSAVDAINRGKIFRFLNKPCDYDDLITAVEAAMEQHDLIVSKRVLLERTLSGVVRLLTGLLSTLRPDLLQEGQRLRDWVRRLAPALDADQRWQAEIASMLVGIGELTVSGGPEDEEQCQAVPSTSDRNAFELVSKIPRLEGVASILLYQHESFANDDQVPQAARLILLLKNWFHLVDQYGAEGLALEALAFHASSYDSHLLQALSQIIGDALEEAHAISVHELKPGDKLMADVFTKDGQRLLLAQELVTEDHLEKLQNFERLFELQEPIFIARPAA